MSKQFLSSLALAAMMASLAAAQQTATPTTPRPGTTTTAPGAVPAAQPGQAGQAGQLDHGIAACLHLANQEEIAMAQFAESRAQHDDVKKFAAMLLKDHREALQKLQSVAPQVASMHLQLQGAADGAQPGAATTTTRPGQPAGQTAGDVGATMIALQRRVAEECLTMTQKELSDKQGPEFDRCFIGQQMGAHVATLAKLRGSREFASPQLQQFIDEATQVVEHHLTEAKQIAKKLEGEHGSHGDNEQARRDGARPQRQ